MIKLLGILFALQLIGCTQPSLEHMHDRAKKEGKICYVVLIPDDIAGNYCLEYKGDKLPNIYSLPK